MVETLHDAAGVRGQRDPELGAVQHRGIGCGPFRVADAGARGHEIQLARPHHRVVARAVAVLDGAREQPAGSLQTCVRVGAHLHTTGLGDVVGPVVVEETPGADETTTALRECAAHRHPAEPAERHLAWFEHLHLACPARAGSAESFFGP